MESRITDGLQDPNEVESRMAAQPRVEHDSAAPQSMLRVFEQFGLEQTVYRACSASQVMRIGGAKNPC